jgi:hypothetical protein
MDKFLDFLLKKAEELAMNAGYSGAYDDGGASALRRQVECYRAGLAGTLPDSWRAHHAEFARLNDPEFATYKRLQAKFET